MLQVLQVLYALHVLFVLYCCMYWTPQNVATWQANLNMQCVILASYLVGRASHPGVTMAKRANCIVCIACMVLSRRGITGPTSPPPHSRNKKKKSPRSRNYFFLQVREGCSKMKGLFHEVWEGCSNSSCPNVTSSRSGSGKVAVRYLLRSPELL